MAIQKVNFELYRGDDTTFILRVKDKNNADVDLSDQTLKMLIRPSRGTAYLMIEGQGLHKSGNVITVTFKHSFHKDWSFRKADYDLQGTNPQGIVKTFIRGTVAVTHDITP